MIVGILCLICSLFATAQKPVAPRGSFSKPGLIARANLQFKNASTLFAASPKAFHSASFSDEDAEKCEEECGTAEDLSECVFEKCPQYGYCYSAEDRECDICDIFDGDNKERYKSWCEAGGQARSQACSNWCNEKYSQDDPSDVMQCNTECPSKIREKKKECRQKCYDDVDADDLRSWQKKCANRCASEFDSPNRVSECAEMCVAYSDCPKDSQSDYEDDCIKKAKESCKEESEDDEEYNLCVKQAEWECEKYADVLCPKVQAWVIILIVVLVVVVAACVVIGIFIFLRSRKVSDQSKETSE